MNMQRKWILLFLAVYLPNIAVAQPSMVAVCEGGSTQSVRTDYTPEKGFEVTKDRATLPMIVYKFDSPKKGSVLITSGTHETTGTIIKDHKNYKTIVYVTGGVPYMDTIYNTGIVFSTEHKSLFSKSASTYRMKCKVER